MAGLDVRVRTGALLLVRTSATATATPEQDEDRKPIGQLGKDPGRFDWPLLPSITGHSTRARHHIVWNAPTAHKIIAHNTIELTTGNASRTQPG